MDVTSPDQNLQDNLRHTLFSWSAQAKLDPIHIQSAKGVYLNDYSGKKYLDFSSQLMNVNIGHGHEEVLAAMKDQIDQVCYVYPGMATRPRGELGKKLAEITPGDLNRTFFTTGGADAIENAIKLARVYTGRHKIVALYRSYHGGTYGAMSAGGDPRKHLIDDQAVPNIIHVENPYYYRCPWNSSSPEECGEMAAAHLERIIQFENPESVAAILIEGESGTSGCIKYPPNYWPLVKQIADRYGILIIDDEVMSGFGRTGKMFAVEHHGVVPDIMCIAKGLTSGYVPMGGIVVREEIARYFDDHFLPLGLTYSAHALACATALAVIEVYEKEGLAENAAAMGRYLENRLDSLKEVYKSIGDFRNTGLLGCIELIRSRKTKEPLVPWNGRSADMEPARRINDRLRELGLFTFVRWNWIFIAPPLNITREQIDEGLGIIEEGLKIAEEYYAE